MTIEIYPKGNEQIERNFQNIYKNVIPKDNSKQIELKDYEIIEEPKKKTYLQNWSAYNQAQTSEKFMFLQIINLLVKSLRIKQYVKKDGRPPLSIEDMIQSCVIKTYNQFSSRRTIGELEVSKALKYIKIKPHFNSINNYMNDGNITRHLQEIIKLSSISLANIEKSVAIDASGISTFCKDKWVSIRLNHKKHRNYKKLHIICGNKTNIIISANVTEGNVSDITQFEPLIQNISRKYNIEKFTADSGYLSRKSVQTLKDMGMDPYIKPKKNTRALSKGYPAWNKMIHLFHDKEDEFRKHYHLRSNVESTFSAMKRIFNPFVKSKKPIAQQNEILCKVISYNISVLIKAVFNLGIELDFTQ